jgi:uncharacterized protein YuzB (UPF0349 family)
MYISYCKKCHLRKRGQNFDTTVTEIEQVLGREVNDIDCQSYCGPGGKKHFVVIDDEIVEGGSQEELLKLIKEKYDN